MRITKENTVGLIIDIQERLFPVMNNNKSLLKNCQILVQGLELLDIPILATQQYTKGLGETISEIKILLPKFEALEKKTFSCWDTPEIAEKFKKLEAKNIIICGIESHVCVLQTAVDLKSEGLNPIVVADCISSRSETNYGLAKERFRSEGITMASYESILFELTRSAEHSAFRAISKLVK